MPEQLSPREERRQYMEMATELLVELRRITEPISKIVNRLIESGDMLALDAADEREEARGAVTRKLTYAKAAAPGTPAPTVQVMDASGEVTERKQRKCGNCHKPGHNAKTCPTKKGKK